MEGHAFLQSRLQRGCVTWAPGHFHGSSGYSHGFVRISSLRAVEAIHHNAQGYPKARLGQTMPPRCGRQAGSSSTCGRFVLSWAFHVFAVKPDPQIDLQRSRAIFHLSQSGLWITSFFQLCILSLSPSRSIPRLSIAPSHKPTRPCNRFPTASLALSQSTTGSSFTAPATSCSSMWRPRNGTNS